MFFVPSSQKHKRKPQITLTECGKDTVAGWLTWGGSVSESKTLVLSPVSLLSSFVSHLIASWRCAKSLQPTTVRLQHVETGTGSQGRREQYISLLDGLHQKIMSNQHTDKKKKKKSVLTLLVINTMWH